MQSVRCFSSARPVRAAAGPARRTLVVVAVKPTKLADFSALSSEELVSKVGALKGELASTRFLQRTRGIAELKPGETQPQPDPEKVPKGHLNRHLRRQVAQCLTVIRQRQIADGIDRRTARKMEKRAALAQGALQKSAQAKKL
jgi:ribosomal protein L29